MALRVPGSLRPRIFSTFGTARVVVRQPNVPAFTPGEIPGSHFQRLSRPQGTWFCRKESRKKSPVTPTGIDPGTARLVAQCLNHYATPGPGGIRLLMLKLSARWRWLTNAMFRSLYPLERVSVPTLVKTECPILGGYCNIFRACAHRAFCRCLQYITNKCKIYLILNFI